MIRLFSLVVALGIASPALADGPFSAKTFRHSEALFVVRNVSVFDHLLVERSSAPNSGIHPSLAFSSQTAIRLGQAYLDAVGLTGCQIGKTTEVTPSFHRLHYHCD